MAGTGTNKVFTEEEKLNVLKTWCDSNQRPMTKLDLTDAVVSDELLVKILTTHQQTLTDLNMTNISGPTYETNVLLETRRFPSLTSLKLTSMELLQSESSKNSTGFASKQDVPPFTTRCPRLKHLLLPIIQKKEDPFSKTFKEKDEFGPTVNGVLSKIFAPLYHLETLDLSYWTKVRDLDCIQPLHYSLTSLILYDVPDLYHAVSTITQMTELTHLDISQSDRKTGIYPRPVSTLQQIVSQLRELTHLDISSTNLTAKPSDDDCPIERKEGSVQSDIVGLQSLKKPLKFLGLFNCDQASHLSEIPAETVAGDANEDQVIKSLQVYKERAGLLQSVLNESYQLYRFGGNDKTPLVRHAEALPLVLDAMERHLSDDTLQIAGSANLFYITRKVQMDNDIKQRVIKAVLSSLEVHIQEQVLVRNCVLILCQFEIPQDILFDYSRLAVLLVSVLQLHDSDNLIQRVIVFLFNSMACHVDNDQKVQICKLGAMEMILSQIRRHHYLKQCDDVMEVGWSFLWNITDESLVNCARFLSAFGLDLFQMCFETFKCERELVRNMMGLIGNIAECDELRCQLMKDDYVKIFCELLEVRDESIEISYNTAGVLANLVSEGEDVWKINLTVSRDEVMKNIVEATNRWDIKTRRFINYRSFGPVLRLLPIYHSYASQQWAVWALANLTTTDREKYCAMVRNGGGVPMLEDLVSITTDEIRALGHIVLDNIRVFESRKALESLDITTQSSGEEPM